MHERIEWRKQECYQEFQKSFFHREALLNTAVYLAWIFVDSKTVTISVRLSSNSGRRLLFGRRDAAGGISVSKFALVMDEGLERKERKKEVEGVEIRSRLY